MVWCKCNCGKLVEGSCEITILGQNQVQSLKLLVQMHPRVLLLTWVDTMQHGHVTRFTSAGVDAIVERYREITMLTMTLLASAE